MTRCILLLTAFAVIPSPVLAETPNWEAERELAREAPAWCPGDPVELQAEILALARVCAHEAGYDSPGDCAAIREVHLNLALARGTSVLEQAWGYSPRALSGRSGRPWLAELGPWCRQPESWPGPGDWALIESLWAEHLLISTRAVLAPAKLGEPCRGTIHDWGCPDCGDRERARRLGLIPVVCRGTENDFYARPSLRRREARAEARRASFSRGRGRARVETL